MKNLEERICVFCGSVFTTSKNSEKKFCNSSCSAKFNNTKREKKRFGNCLYCGEELNRKGKKFCNNQCQGKYSTEKTFQKIMKGESGFHEETYKRYLINKYGAKCMKCGWNEVNPITKLIPIQMEHVDGNSDNNNLSNLILLCPNCHSLTPTFGALNKKNGISKRKDKRNQKRNI